MSKALDYATETVGHLLPEDRMALMHKMVRYCFFCGRVGVPVPARMPVRECHYCGGEWKASTWTADRFKGGVKP